MPRRPKHVNEQFFDEESKAMWYVLGISFAQLYQSEGKKQNIWYSGDKTLVEIVKSSIDSEHTITTRKGSFIKNGKEYFQHRLGVNNQNIFDVLKERGLGVPKSERTFPKDIEEQYLDHFVRGFFDAQVSCVNYIQGIKRKGEIYEHPTQQLKIRFNVSFLRGLYDVLVGYANVKDGKEVSKPLLVLAGKDTSAVYDFLYRDWNFIQENGLYLPSKKARFETNQIISDPSLKTDLSKSVTPNLTYEVHTPTLS